MHIILRFGGNFHAIVHQTFHIVDNIVEIIRQSRIAFSVLHSLQVRLSEALLRAAELRFRFVNLLHGNRRVICYRIHGQCKELLNLLEAFHQFSSGDAGKVSSAVHDTVNLRQNFVASNRHSLQRGDNSQKSGRLLGLRVIHFTLFIELYDVFGNLLMKFANTGRQILQLGLFFRGRRFLHDILCGLQHVHHQVGNVSDFPGHQVQCSGRLCQHVAVQEFRLSQALCRFPISLNQPADPTNHQRNQRQPDQGYRYVEQRVGIGNLSGDDGHLRTFGGNVLYDFCKIRKDAECHCRSRYVKGTVRRRNSLGVAGLSDRCQDCGDGGADIISQENRNCTG